MEGCDIPGSQTRAGLKAALHQAEPYKHTSNSQGDHDLRELAPFLGWATYKGCKRELH